MSENIENENYAADRPISEAKEDKFQRYNFSKKIADTIINRESNESIVFGIFGAWGEGKSSVMNFIDNELQADSNIIRIQLNPWRYSDEDSLLINFFKKIALVLGKQLEKRKEKLGNLVKKYGALTNVFGIDISSVGNILSDTEVETYKERIEEILKESEQRIVVFVDDIDRLDKQELYSLFRLVKLTADFAHTTYILSFDEAMVAAAIGDRFGEGNKNAGASFLEKIIQVPLTIPRAQPEALKKFTFDLINTSLNNIDIPENEVQRFIYQFSTNVLPVLKTPRLAVRYGNILSFSIPLLYGEVNVVDLMLIEAIKIFYPEYYFLIKNNPEYFIGSYKAYDNSNNQQKISEIKSHLEKLGETMSRQENECLRDLLSNLFPNLSTVFGNYHFTDRDKNEWFIYRRIVSPKYFDRYFSYAVIEGDISDIEFDELLNDVDSKDVKDIAVAMRAIISDSAPGTFTDKLRARETYFEWEKGVKIIRAICQITDLFPKAQGLIGLGHSSVFDQAAILIYQILKTHKDKEIFSFAKELMTLPADFNFAYCLNNWFRFGQSKDDKLFSEDEYVELAKLIVDRAVQEAGDGSIFEKFPDQVHFIIPTWSARDSAGLHGYIEKYLNKSKDKVLLLLKAFVPIARSSSRKDSFYSDITKKQFEYITSSIDENILYFHILENYSIEEIKAEEPYWIDFGDHEFEILNMVRQFVKWYEEDQAILDSSEE